VNFKATAAPAVALPAWSASARAAASDGTVPFTFRATDAALMDLKRRIDQTRWPERETGAGWEQGSPLAALRDFVDY